TSGCGTGVCNGNDIWFDLCRHRANFPVDDSSCRLRPNRALDDLLRLGDTNRASDLQITMSETFESKRAPEPVGAFPHAKRVGNLLFLSGIGPRVRGSREIPGVMLNVDGQLANYDIEKQCRAVFENVKLVLEDAGASWSDIVDVTVFLTNMKKDF